MRGIFLSTAANEELNLEPFRILKNHKGRHGAGGFHLGAEGWADSPNASGAPAPERLWWSKNHRRWLIFFPGLKKIELEFREAESPADVTLAKKKERFFLPKIICLDTIFDQLAPKKHLLQPLFWTSCLIENRLQPYLLSLDFLAFFLDPKKPFLSIAVFDGLVASCPMRSICNNTFVTSATGGWSFRPPSPENTGIFALDVRSTGRCAACLVFPSSVFFSRRFAY